VKFLPALCHWADLGSWPTACESSLVLCALKRKRKKVVAHDDHYNAPFVFVASTWCCYLPPIKGLPELHLPCLCLVETLIPKTTTSCKYPIQNLKACMHVFANGFFPFTHYFFLYNQLFKKWASTNEKRQCEKEIWQAHGKRSAQWPTLKEQECKFQKQLSFYLCMYFRGSSPTEEPYGIMPTWERAFFNCSYVPIKRQSVACLNVLVFKGSPEVQENPWALGLKSLNRTHLYMNLPYNVTTSERTLSVFRRQITFSNQAYKKSPRAEGVRL